MPEDRIPYNIEFCKFINCDKKKGNKCEIEVCPHNFKRIKYWEIFGEYPPGQGA